MPAGAPDGEPLDGRAAAFVDLDHTLIRGSSAVPLAWAASRRGWATDPALLREFVRFVTARGTRSGGSRDSMLTRVLTAIAGRRQADLIDLAGDVAPGLARAVVPIVRERLAEHAARGQDRILMSASPIELVERLADRLGLEGALGTRAEVRDGRYTGRLAGPLCHGIGRAEQVRALADDRGYALPQCLAYSDSASDLPLFELVGHPIPVNPGRALRALAAERGWHTLDTGASWRELLRIG